MLSSRGSRSSDRAARKDKRARARSGSSRDRGHRSRSLSPLPVRGPGAESVGGGHRRGRCLPVCDPVEIGRGLLTATALDMDALILGETGLDAGTAVGVTGRVLRIATDHVVSVRVPQLVGEVGVTGRGHTIPQVACVTVRGHTIDDLPPLTAHGLWRKDDEPDEISRRVVRRFPGSCCI